MVVYPGHGQWTDVDRTGETKFRRTVYLGGLQILCSFYMTVVGLKTTTGLTVLVSSGRVESALSIRAQRDRFVGPSLK